MKRIVGRLHSSICSFLPFFAAACLSIAAYARARNAESEIKPASLRHEPLTSFRGRPVQVLERHGFVQIQHGSSVHPERLSILYLGGCVCSLDHKTFLASTAEAVM